MMFTSIWYGSCCQGGIGPLRGGGIITDTCSSGLWRTSDDRVFCRLKALNGLAADFVAGGAFRCHRFCGREETWSGTLGRDLVPSCGRISSDRESDSADDDSTVLSSTLLDSRYVWTLRRAARSGWGRDSNSERLSESLSLSA